MAKKSMVEKNKSKQGSQYRNRCGLCGRQEAIYVFLVYVGYVLEIWQHLQNFQVLQNHLGRGDILIWQLLIQFQICLQE